MITRIAVIIFALLISIATGLEAQNFPPDFIAKNAASGATFTIPVGIVSAPGNRIFVIEKRGKVFAIDNGQEISSPFIDLEREILSNNARGLIGIAGHTRKIQTALSKGYHHIAEEPTDRKIITKPY